MTSVNRVYATISTKQNRLVCEASAPTRAMVVRDFSPATIGKDGRDASDCTHCVAVLGLADSGPKKGKPIVITAYPLVPMRRETPARSKLL
jgi:hypothetical protein